jgi:hypothetical protein
MGRASQPSGPEFCDRDAAQDQLLSGRHGGYIQNLESCLHARSTELSTPKVAVRNVELLYKSMLIDLQHVVSVT